MRRKSILTVAMTLFVVGATACGSSGGSAGGSGSAPSLDGTDWVLTSMAPSVPNLGRVTITAQFAGGNLSGHSGCNTYRTSYTQNGDSLTIGQNVASTQIPCPSVPSAVERAYLARLPQVKSFSKSGSTLTLKDADGKALL